MTITFGDAVESDTIANMLTHAVGWTVTVHHPGGADTGELVGLGLDGVTIKLPPEDADPEAGDRMGVEWTDLDNITIH
jgi:hypothetical protein